jgi:hypothetical protein
MTDRLLVFSIGPTIVFDETENTLCNRFKVEIVWSISQARMSNFEARSEGRCRYNI